MTVDVKYSTQAKANGGGREGVTQLASGMLTVTMASPVELGGSGKGHNPEELFAMGYAACFLSAMRFVARAEKRGEVPEEAAVTSNVGFGPDSNGGFGLTVDLTVSLPGMERDQAEALVARAHEVCPYSNATRNNIDVNLTLAA